MAVMVRGNFEPTMVMRLTQGLIDQHELQESSGLEHKAILNPRIQSTPTSDRVSSGLTQRESETWQENDDAAETVQPRQTSESNQLVMGKIPRSLQRDETYVLIQRQESLRCHPHVVKAAIRPALTRRSRVPSSKNLARDRPGLLSSGPSGYVRTPVSSRPTGYEAFRDHGIRPRRKSSALMLLSNPSILCDTEDTQFTDVGKLIYGYKAPMSHSQMSIAADQNGGIKQKMTKKLAKLRQFFKKK